MPLNIGTKKWNKIIFNETTIETLLSNTFDFVGHDVSDLPPIQY